MLKNVSLIAISLLTVTLTGCVEKKTSYSALTPQEQPQTISLPDCEKELQALKEVDIAKHTELEKRFEQMMSGSANYANVRNVVNPGTQNTIDSLYNYQSSKVCAEIRKTMLESLIDKSGAEQ